MPGAVPEREIWDVTTACLRCAPAECECDCDDNNTEENDK